MDESNGGDKPDYWFPAKRFGWGWGFPNNRAGWAVMLGYLVALALSIVFVPPEEGQVLVWLAIVFALTAILLMICYKKGEPPRWRWGGE